MLAALLGGAYSSTVTTVVMARRAAREQHPHLFAGGILIASGVMYLRLVMLLALFNRQLMSILARAVPCAGGAGVWRRLALDAPGRQERSSSQAGVRAEEPARSAYGASLCRHCFWPCWWLPNWPLRIWAEGGVNTLAAIMGVSDVDPFIMGLTQAAGTLTPLNVAAGAILIAAASNNIVKGIYAFSLADRKTGLQSLVLLLALAALGLDSPVLAGSMSSRACSHYWGGWRCERKSGQTKPSPKAVAGPPSRARMKYGRIFAATRRAGANFPDFVVDRR